MEKSKSSKVCSELRQLSNLISREILTENTHAKEFVSDMTGWILAYLAGHEGENIFQKDIEDVFAIRRSTVSKKISLMEQKGLVRRVSVPYDARLKKLEITEKSREILAPIMNNAASVESRLTEGLTDDEIDTLCYLICKLRTNLEK